MKLFRKKLNSVAELRREKLKLQFMRSHTSSDALMPPIKELKRKKKKDSGPVQTIMDLAGARGPLQSAMVLAGPVGRLLGLRSGKNFLRKAALEIIGGYLAYKAIRLAIGMIRNSAKRKAAKAEREKLAAEVAAVIAKKNK